ncbi:alpha/beta fold hydrolase [Microbacterium memoriense]|uniref:Alpha/beta hydrolase n=1 Tax=Microbacterium memoriense TaxID=2978350 RepID=A0ABT2P9S3_9MICO|nr:alpha/beta hydrolase [Microbacterium memoriense]MCT9001369.1 alpha/beta hydrolase [Microbacterium memoriense]
MTQERQTFEPDGRAVAYIDEGSGPAVVLLPAAGLDFAYLGTLASILVEEDFRVVRIGSRSAGTATMHDLAHDVVDVLTELGIGDAWIGGHAFGGAVARTVALDHHDRVNGILLLGVEAGTTVDRSAALTAVFGEDYAPDAALEERQVAALLSTPTPEWATIAPDTPTLVIQGSADEITPADNGFALQASAPALVSVKSVEGAGHLFVLTHPGETSWFIEDYLDWD